MNQEDIPWVNLIWQAHYQDNKLPQSRAPCGSFWSKDCLALWNDFMELAMVKANARRTVRIWKDEWMETPAMEEFPHLFSFARDQDCILEKFHALRDDDIVDNFQLPLSITAGHECEELSQMLQNWAGNKDTNIKDQWEFEWKGKYSCKKVYAKLDPSDIAPPPFQWIWKSRALPEQKFFFGFFYWID